MSFEEHITPQVGSAKEQMASWSGTAPGSTLLEDFADPSNPHANTVLSIHERASQMLERTKTQCDEMLSQTAQSCRSLREQEKQRGYDEGREEGLKAADEESASLLAMCENIALSVAKERDHTLSQAEGDLVSLALQVAEKVVGVAIEADENLVVEALRSTLRRAYNRSEVVVLAHPDDIDLLRAEGSAVAESMGGIDSISFVAERRVDRGGVIVRTPTGEIDGTPEGKMERIGDRLRELISVRLNRETELDK